MDLSILIPVYRWDCTQLVSDLKKQADALHLAYEIIQANDEKLRYGRAKVRNFLASRAKGKWLLFLDCDATVDNERFLQNYMEAAPKAPVVCGGCHHADKLPSKNVSLRWKYERRADRKRSAKNRSRHPYSQFSTFNFLIERETFLNIQFDETCVGYGHEDTLFGAELEQRSIPVLHIDNPLRHDGLETNARYMEKTREALRNLRRKQDELSGYSPLLRTYHLLVRLGLDDSLASFFEANRDWFEKQMRKKNPSLFLFSIYKLAYYCHI
ncbi:MAG: glycosyltransferase [Bacteroidaceae bacterium]|nr:glycosyltransferase [Bacteroidaceae bacterium]